MPNSNQPTERDPARHPQGVGSTTASRNDEPPRSARSQGCAVHYSASGAAAAHRDCASSVRGIQNYHMDGQGWQDIAYNWLFCRHGYLFRGRGLGDPLSGERDQLRQLELLRDLLPRHGQRRPGRHHPGSAESPAALPRLAEPADPGADAGLPPFQVHVHELSRVTNCGR